VLKCVCGQGSAQAPLGELTAEREWKRKEGEGRKGMECNFFWGGELASLVLGEIDAPGCHYLLPIGVYCRDVPDSNF